jgi:hypothetical protein
MDKPGANFQPLIAALEDAGADPRATLSEQLARLELFLVAAELDPNVIPAVEIFWALKALRTINLKGRSESTGTEDLAPFFQA